MSEIISKLRDQERQIKDLNVYINLCEIDSAYLLSLFNMITELNRLSNMGKNITVYWNTNNDLNIYKIARDFEKIMKGQLFYADI